MFSKIRSRIAPDIGIDLGAMNTRVFVKGKGVVLEVPTVVAIQTYSKRVLAVGDDAKEMLGRTPGEIVVVYPLKGGVIADYDLTEAFLRYVLEKVFTRPWWARCFKPRAVIAVPSGITEVEKCAVETAAHAAGVGEVFLIERPMAAAIGAGLPVSEPRGCMIVDVGASTCDVAVISLAGIVHIVSERAASGDAMDDCVLNHMRQAHRLLVDEQTAEAVKRMVGSACSVDSEPNMDMRGRDIVMDDVKTVKVTAEEIRSALAKPVSHLVSIVRQVRELCEPKLATDIADCGIVLTGGGSLLRGLDKFLSKEVRIPVRLADNPLLATVEGTGVVLDEIDFLVKNRKTCGASRDGNSTLHKHRVVVTIIGLVLAALGLICCLLVADKMVQGRTDRETDADFEARGFE